MLQSKNYFPILWTCRDKLRHSCVMAATQKKKTPQSEPRTQRFDVARISVLATALGELSGKLQALAAEMEVTGIKSVKAVGGQKAEDGPKWGRKLLKNIELALEEAHAPKAKSKKRGRPRKDTNGAA